MEVHKKGLQSCAAEPLKNQSKYLMNTLLSSKTWTREQRLGALENVGSDEVEQFAKDFFDSHSLECLFYGSITKDQVVETVLVRGHLNLKKSLKFQLLAEIFRPPPPLFVKGP